MGELSIYHWLLVLCVLLLLFGGRKIPDLMRGLGSSIGAFREGLSGKTRKSDLKEKT
jgi:sec-independent protein translocase protein TatA